MLKENNSAQQRLELVFIENLATINQNRLSRFKDTDISRDLR